MFVFTDISFSNLFHMFQNRNFNEERKKVFEDKKGFFTEKAALRLCSNMVNKKEHLVLGEFSNVSLFLSIS